MLSRFWTGAILAAAAAASLALGAPGASAQGYPERPIKLIVPYPPGGSGDLLSRPIAAKLKDILGQSVVIDNKQGANGILGLATVSTTAPDGYTLFLGAIGPLTVSPAMQKLSFDPVKDFTPVVYLAGFPNVLVVHPSSPAKSVAELVALAKSKPGQLNYGSAGIASSNQLAAELFNLAAGVKTAHIPYKGGAPAVADLVAGHLSYMFDNVPSSLQQIKAGSLRALAVTSAKRQASLPDVPTMIELGYPNFEAGAWFGVLAPAGTPRPVVERLNKAMLEALRDPALRDQLVRAGYEINAGSPEQFAQFIQSESVKWQAVVKAAGMVGQ